MIIERIILREYNWAVTVLMDCDKYDSLEIADHLLSINCPTHLIKYSIKTLNKGLTYSNFKLGRSIMVFNRATNNRDLINTSTHECYHLVLHISKARNIQEEETLALLTGKFNALVWIELHLLIKGSN